MKTYDNQNRLVGEINTTFMQDGSVVTSNTIYNPNNGQAISQNISVDLLAYLGALLKRSGYEVITTRNLSDAVMFVKVTRPRILICGPGMQTNESATPRFREVTPGVQLLLLSSDFSTAEAGQAGIDLVNRIRLLLSSQQ